MHPEYIWPYNDLSILKLPFPLNWTESVGPACLPDASFTPEENGLMGFISGWGVTKNGKLNIK